MRLHFCIKICRQPVDTMFDFRNIVVQKRAEHFILPPFIYQKSLKKSISLF